MDIETQTLILAPCREVTAVNLRRRAESLIRRAERIEAQHNQTGGVMTTETRQPVICASCGWTGKRLTGTTHTCPKCGEWVTFEWREW